MPGRTSSAGHAAIAGAKGEREVVAVGSLLEHRAEGLQDVVRRAEQRRHHVVLGWLGHRLERRERWHGVERAVEHGDPGPLAVLVLPVPPALSTLVRRLLLGRGDVATHEHGQVPGRGIDPGLLQALQVLGPEFRAALGVKAPAARFQLELRAETTDPQREGVLDRLGGLADRVGK